MARNQMMPRRGSVRHPSGKPGHGLRGTRKGSPAPSPRPGKGAQGMTPQGSFTSRPNAGKIQPRGSRGSNSSSGYARFGKPRGGKVNPRGSGERAAPNWSKH